MPTRVTIKRLGARPLAYRIENSPLTPEASSPLYRRIVGYLMLLLGASVFIIRFQHAGSYALPQGGNLLAGLLALAIGTILIRPTLGAATKALGWLALAASPIVFFFALYATLAELEEVVVLNAMSQDGEPSALRLWVVDYDDAVWVTMPRDKADAHSLGQNLGQDRGQEPVELFRQGEVSCVVATRFEDRESTNRIHSMRHEKYSIQRLATTAGLFGREADPATITLRLDPCPGPAPV
jgi:hypothetical protein